LLVKLLVYENKYREYINIENIYGDRLISRLIENII